jgi:hypothetical protein
MAAAVGACLGGSAPAATDKPAASEPAAPAFVVVFDFATTGERDTAGAELADSLRLRLARHGGCQVVDAPTTRQFSAPAPSPAPAADPNDVRALMSKLAVNIALWGTVNKTNASVSAAVHCLDLRDPSTPREWTKTFTDDTERARGEIARQIAEALWAQAEWTPPQYGDEAEPTNFSKPLNANGDFEQDSAGWEAPDNASTFLVAGQAGPATAKRSEAGRGQVLKIRTDLARDPWLEYRRKLMFGQADPNHPPQIPTDTGYGSVGGSEGVHFCSDWIKASPGRRYWLTADVKCPKTGEAFPKIFVKGFRDMGASAEGLPERSLVERNLTPQAFAALPEKQRKELIAADAKAHGDRYRREVYRWYLACRNSSGDWTHVAAPFPPRGGLPADVQWLQIQIYAYWPPGEYLFDNVFLYADPRQQASLPKNSPEEPARTPNVRH